MALLTESDDWPGIYQLEEDDPVLGGPLPAGISNRQPTELASRTKYLRLRGISPWDPTFEYPQDAYVSDAGKSWHSLVANTNVQPGTDPTKWERWGYTENDQAGLSNADPAMNGDAAPGTAAAASRADHVHPNDTSRAPLASPVFTGTPAAPTAAAATNTTQLATTAFVQAAIATLINSAPGALDTLDELAAAMGDDANFVATMTTALAGKQATHANLTSLASTTAAIIAKLIELGGTTAVSVAELDFLNGVTSAIQTQLNAKAALASPALTGTPTAPTAAAATNTTQLATTEFVQAAVSASQQAGEVCYFASDTAPTGFLKANGAGVSRTTYATLFAAIGTRFGVGDGATTFNLPDLRGEFIRGWDDSRGLDANRALGSVQGDAFQGHQHTYIYLATAAVRAGSNGGTPFTDSARSTSAIVNDGVNGDPRVATETRPRNMALLACIKY